MNRPSILALASLACAALLQGCASDPPATPSIAAGTAALEAARSAGAPEFAAADLDQARGKLERARALAQAGKNREAIRLAEQAEVDAQLARASAGSERSTRALNEVEASLRSLREELNRAATTQPVRP
jgi:hypothetical protein